MSKELQVDAKLIEAFHLMYDHFPEAAQLAHKSKQVVAVNPACRRLGREPGMICAKHGPPEAHKGCLAARAVSEQRGLWKKAAHPATEGRDVTIYWLPIDGYPDFYIHFGTGYINDEADTQAG